MYVRPVLTWRINIKILPWAVKWCINLTNESWWELQKLTIGIKPYEKAPCYSTALIILWVKSSLSITEKMSWLYLLNVVHIIMYHHFSADIWMSTFCIIYQYYEWLILLLNLQNLFLFMIQGILFGFSFYSF